MMLLAQELAYQNFGPRAASHDRDGTWPRENFENLRQHGFLDLRVPKTFGGKGAGNLAFSITTIEISKGDPSTGLAFAQHSTVMTLLEHLADREQQARYYGLVVGEGKQVAACVLEPGWNLFSGELPQTTLTPHGGGYRLKGRKYCCAGAESADVLFVNALLDGNVLGVLLPRRAGGVLVSGGWDSLSLRGSRSVSVELDDVEVDAADVIQLPLNLLFELEYELGICAVYLSAAETAYRYARELVRPAMARVVESASGHDHPTVGRTFGAVGRMRIELEGAWASLVSAAHSRPVGSFMRGWALARTKHIVAETACRVVSDAMQVAGVAGLARELPLERLFRDVQAARAMGITPDDAAYLAGRFELGIAPKGIVIDRNLMRGG